MSQYLPTLDPKRPMFKHQKSLPMLPVPTLKESCDRYWKSALPLFASDEEKLHTRQAIDSFLASPLSGQLQQRLLDRQSQMAKSGKSWLIDWWNDYAYMSYRDPVVLNVNYFFQFIDDKKRMVQTHRAASLITGAMEFRDLCISQTLEADMAGRGKDASGLCMYQYQFMFNACRIPKVPADSVHTYDYSKNHVAVVRKGKFYVFDLINASGARLSTLEIAAQLEQIKAHADVNGFEKFPLGALTTENRDIWTNARKQLLDYSPGNQEALEKLESAVFLVCLDDSSPVTRNEVGRALWHGDGKNRWFDKALQFIVFENGKAGFNGEHSMMDATPTYRMCDFICERDHKTPVEVESVDASNLKKPEPLLFHLPESFGTFISTAVQRFNADVSRHDHNVLAFNNYGKELIKTFRMSPDAFVQLSIQLAFYKMFGESRATYESAQTKKYAYGRTETCRSCTEESVAFVKAAVDPSVPPVDKAALARKAIAAHVQYMNAAVDGHGVDRHFLGLRKLIKSGEKMPEIFSDPMFAKSCHWNLSTSQISSEYFDGYGWGQVVPDGYGLAYMVKEHSLHYNVASLKGGPGRQDGPGSWKGKGKGIAHAPQKMSAYLEESLMDLKHFFIEEMKAGKGAGAVKSKL